MSNKEMISAEPLIEYMKHNAVTTHQMAEALGVTNSAISSWRKQNRMSRIALIALEGIKRRNGSTARASIFVATCPPEQLPAFESFCKAIHIDLAKVKLE